MNNEVLDKDRVVSFSYKPHDKEAYTSILELKSYGKKRGISFSFLILQAIKSYLNELNNGSGSR